MRRVPTVFRSMILSVALKAEATGSKKKSEGSFEAVREVDRARERPDAVRADVVEPERLTAAEGSRGVEPTCGPRDLSQAGGDACRAGIAHHRQR